MLYIINSGDNKMGFAFGIGAAAAFRRVHLVEEKDA